MIHASILPAGLLACMLFAAPTQSHDTSPSSLALSLQESRPTARPTDAPAETGADKKSGEEEKKRELPSVESGKDKAVDAVDRFVAQQKQEGKIDTSNARWKTNLPKPPKLEFDPEHEYFWNMRTNKGDIRIRFMPDVAPMHVSSFIYLSRLGFYDNLKFHRVIAGFMAQGGDPLGTGGGGPGYSFGLEVAKNVKHDRAGVLSMARTNDPNSAGSQFFLTFAPTPHLDGQYSIFGEVVEGLDVVRLLEAAATPGSETPR